MLAVGLGNPTEQYEGTRHNVGAEAVRVVAARHQIKLRSERGLRAQVAVATRGDHTLALAVPTTYMNDSGLAVRALVRRYLGGDRSAAGGPESLVIVHDELDLEPGVVRVKVGGGTAGHNGLRSIQSHLKHLEFARVRIGVGKPPGRSVGAEYVLKRPSKPERMLLEVAIEVAADAVECLFVEDAERAMNRFNTR